MVKGWLLVCLIWFFISQSTFFFSIKYGTCLPGMNQQELMCLAQGHNAVMPVRLEPATPRSQVKHSRTEPLSSLWKGVKVATTKYYMHERVIIMFTLMNRPSQKFKFEYMANLKRQQKTYSPWGAIANLHAQAFDPNTQCPTAEAWPRSH